MRISRQRFGCRLRGADANRIALLVGPAGSGKSELLRAYRHDSNVLYFRAGNEDATFASFVHGLAQAVLAVAPGAEASFPRAWERALQSRSAGTILAHWLVEHLHGVDHALVIDDLHAGAADENIAAFIARFAELRPNAGLTIALRDPGKLPVALWMATQRLDRPIDERELRFDEAETAEAAALFGVVFDRATFSGPAVTLIYALTQLQTNAGRYAAHAPAESFDAIAESIYRRRSERERDFLLSAALFPTMESALLQRSGWSDSDAIRTALESDAGFIWEADSDGEIRFFDRFRDYLGGRFAAKNDSYRTTIAGRTVRSLCAAGRHAAALAVATRQGLTATIGELLDEHGFALLEAGNVGAIGEALESFDAPGRTSSPSAMALQGYIDARTGRLDTSEAWFRLSLEKPDDDASRVAIAMYYARELAWRRRTDACDVLAPFADSLTLPRHVLIDVRSSYAQALIAADRLAEAAERTDDVVAIIEQDAPIGLRARVFARAAYVALECGFPALARERALIAAPLAVNAALYDVAASTYSVLSNIAYEIDDDGAASLRYLQRLRDLAVKSGTLRFDLYALLGMYNLHAEAGNDAALFKLEAQIAGADKHDATTEIMEALVPAKALQAACGARFTEAAQLLRSIVELQPTAERRALCWAEIALYDAAAGQFDSVGPATDAASAALQVVDARTTLFGRAQVLLGLAAWTCGDEAGAATWLDESVHCSLGTTRRLAALRDALAALLTGIRDPIRFDAEMTAALARLRDCAFGGMAQVIQALPDRFTQVNETVGSRLARDMFPVQFAAAVAASDISLLREWLAQSPGAKFSDVSLVERFDKWVATAPQPGTRAAIAAVRTQIASYRPEAAAFVRLVDDIDASIQRLFEHLDIAAPLMAEHSRAVSAWCARIARAFGMAEAEIEFITRGGLIHDVGKIVTPAEILNAPRQLDEREWEIMRDHAAEGGRMIAKHESLRSFIPIVRGHHERLDGRGYPDGLRGSLIPFPARIVAVADSFNAMIGRRPYRLPLAPTEALAELERHRGTQFDPEVVYAIIQIVLGRPVDGRRP